MKTIEQLEKEFDKKFGCIETIEYHGISIMKDYIFQELLPQVLSDMMPDVHIYCDCVDVIKQKAKEMGIKL